MAVDLIYQTDIVYIVDSSSEVLARLVPALLRSNRKGRNADIIAAPTGSIP